MDIKEQNVVQLVSMICSRIVQFALQILQRILNLDSELEF